MSIVVCSISSKAVSVFSLQVKPEMFILRKFGTKNCLQLLYLRSNKNLTEMFIFRQQKWG